MKTTRVALAAAALTSLVTAIGPPADAAPPARAPVPRAAATALLSPSFPGDAYPAYDLGIQSRPTNVSGRDAGYSALIGETSLWAYGDTLSTSGGGFHSNTGALDVQGFLPVREPTTGGFPTSQLVPFSTTEANYNATHTGSRYWVWPTGIIPRPSPQTSLVFWERGLDPAVTGSGAVGLADVTEGQTVASRRPTALFGGQDCSWNNPLLGTDGYVYLYASRDEPGKDRTNCPNGTAYASFERIVARAPLASAGTTSAYRYWNGSSWGTSATSAAVVLDVVGAQVTWSPALNKYVAIGGFGNGSNYSTASAPQGPWATSAQWITPKSSSFGFGNYAWINHPEHNSADGGVLLTSYHRSTGVTTGDIHLLAVDTRPNPDVLLAGYIDRVYQEMLGRSASSSDLSYWAPRLEGRTTTVPTFTRTLARSTEGLRHRVEQVYQAVLGRSASSSEEIYWAGEMAANDWGHDILVAKVASAPELSSQYPANGDYVDAVYPLTLGRAADSGGRSYWVGQLNSGVSRYSFVRTLMQSDESGRRQANLAYQDILGRPATATQAAAVSGRLRDAIEIRFNVAATAEAIGA